MKIRIGNTDVSTLGLAPSEEIRWDIAGALIIFSNLGGMVTAP